MTIANNNVVAKIAAVVAGLGLVAMSFAVGFAPAAKADTTTDLQAQISALLAQIAALQAQIGGSTTTTTTVAFSRDLTMGSSGADVTSLQTWLMSKGYAIPAGATGYFGAQTKAALAAYQAANGISPAAGYFGPITRAKVNASAGTTTTTTGTGTTTTTTGGTTTLHGGEADLTNYDLVSEQGDFAEGDSNTAIATAEFDVDGGDISVQRADLEFQAESTSEDVKPWKYVDSISVYDGDTKLGSVDASDQDNWDDSDTDSSMNGSTAKLYKVSLTGLSDVIKEGDTANLTFKVTAQDTIDSDNEGQSFTVRVPEQGIRAIDAAGIQQYTGDDGEKVSVDVNSAENGKLTVRENSDDPNAGVLVADDQDTSDDFTVLAFDIKNSDDADTKVTDLDFNVTSASSSVSNLIRKATLDFGGKKYDADISGTTHNPGTGHLIFSDMDAVVNGNDTETGTLTVELYGQSGHFAATGESLTVSLAAADVTAEGDESGDDVDSSDISGTANGNTQAIAVNGGITVEGNSNSASLTYNSTNPANSYGTFTLKFDVTAVGDDVYVPKAVQALASGTAPNATTGVVLVTDLSASTTSSTVTASLTTTADSDNATYYVVHDGDTETFTAQVTINPTADGDYQVGLNSIRFSSTDQNTSNLQTLDVDQTDSDFQTDPLHIPNS